VEKMEAKDLEYESLRVRLYRNTSEFARFKEQTIRQAGLQENAIMTHSELAFAESTVSRYVQNSIHCAD